MATFQHTRVRGRLSPLEYLIAAQAKCAQAQAVLRQAVSVHTPSALDRMSVEAIQGHLDQALCVIADVRAARNPPKPFSSLTPQVIGAGRVLFAIEESSND